MRKLYEYLAANGMTYEQYLRSDHWKDVRRRYWASKLHKRKCYCCGNGAVPLEVHHKTYKSLGNEKLHHLLLLCRSCHERTHEIDRTRKKGCLWGAARRLRKIIEKERRYRDIYGEHWQHHN